MTSTGLAREREKKTEWLYTDYRKIPSKTEPQLVCREEWENLNSNASLKRIFFIVFCPLLLINAQRKWRVGVFLFIIKHIIRIKLNSLCFGLGVKVVRLVCVLV